MLFQDKTFDAVKESMAVGGLNAEEDHEAMMMVLKNYYNNTLTAVRQPGMSARIHNGRKEAFIPIAFTSMLVDKIAALVYSRWVSRSVEDEVLSKKLQSVYKGSQSTFLRLAKISSLCGFAAVRLSRKWTGEIKFITYGFDEVKPILDPEDPHGKPLGLIFDVNTQDLPAWVNAAELKEKKGSYNFVEMITRHLRDETGEIIEHGVYRAFVDDREITTPFPDNVNPLGDYLGAVYWRGLDHPFNPKGKSDIMPLLQMLESLNELMTDGKELLTWSIHSPIITNAAGNLDWAYGPRSIFQINMTADGATPFANRLSGGSGAIKDLAVLLDILLDLTHQTSRIPSVAVGSLTGIGKASSGRAFEIAMTPAKELVAEKENVCIPQELDLMEEVTAKMIYHNDFPGKTYLFNGVNMPDPRHLRKVMETATVSFSPLSIPQESIAETRTSEVSGGIKSREQAIREEHPGWDQTKIDEELERIDSENKQEADALATETLNGLKQKLDAK